MNNHDWDTLAVQEQLRYIDRIEKIVSMGLQIRDVEEAAQKLYMRENNLITRT